MSEWRVPSSLTNTWFRWDRSADRPFLNRLIRDYFLARKIVREVRTGNLEILVRHHFPEEHVLLFLALMAPEVAAKATADRSDAIRAEIESEVERRLQLTLAHALKRSVGAVRAHFRTIEGVPLRSCLDPIIEELRQVYPVTSCTIDVDAVLRVRASRELLREIFHGLLENAFHATAFADGLAAPRVEVRARTEGATVRVDIVDNGPGVAPGDRERIFDLYVTTKKGGDGKPLGTGMGLPIARRYAQHIGGQVGLDPDHEQTCFFVRLVAWRDLG